MDHILSPTLSITIYPNTVVAEYLSVVDVVGQLQDLVDVLKFSEHPNQKERKIDWRLTFASTQSPELRVDFEPYVLAGYNETASDPRPILNRFKQNMRDALAGNPSINFWENKKDCIESLLDRCTNGIARTDIMIEGENLQIHSEQAKIARTSIAQKTKLETDLDEVGELEGLILGITRTLSGDARITIKDRLSGRNVICTLDKDLSNKIGPAHNWEEVWEGRSVWVKGILGYNVNGLLNSAQIDDLEEIEWPKVSLEEIRRINILEGKSIPEYLAITRKGLDD